MSNIQVFPNVFPTLMPLQQGNLLKLQQQILHGVSRSSRPQVFCRKALLKVTHNSQINTRLIKLQTGGACNFFKKRLQHRCFPVKFAKILRTPILNNICERLLLHPKYYTPANNTAEAVTKFSKIATTEEDIQFETEEFFFLKVANPD